MREKVTIGVMHRVDKLADRKNGFKPENAPVFILLFRSLRLFLRH